MPKPFYKVHIEISNICNLQCSFCPEVIRQKRVMAPATFETIARQVSTRTKMVALHLMGDPLVHPRLGEIVEICDRLGLKIFLVTNGVLLKDENFETLLHPAFRQINFSLHSFADNYGTKDPSTYLDAIFRFTELAFERRSYLFINYRLWNLNEPRGVGEENRALLRRIGERFEKEIPEDRPEGSPKNFIVKNRLSLHFDTEFVWPALELPVLGDGGTCYGLRSHIGVLVDGTVVPCCLDKEGAINLGNILQTPLDVILAGPRASAVRNGFREGRLVEDLCRRCHYIQRFQVG